MADYSQISIQILVESQEIGDKNKLKEKLEKAIRDIIQIPESVHPIGRTGYPIIKLETHINDI